MTVSVRSFGRYAVLEDGTMLPITNLFDIDGDETDDPDEAVSFVAGEGGVWVSGSCDDFPEVNPQ